MLKDQYGYGSYRRRFGSKRQCNEVCQYKYLSICLIPVLKLIFRRLLGLENDEESDEHVDSEPSQPEVSSIAPCVGLCHVERVQELEKDDTLKQLEKEPNECVGLCFIYR